MGSEWVVGIFTISGVVVTGIITYVLKRQEINHARQIEEIRNRRVKLEELHRLICQQMQNQVKFVQTVEFIASGIDQPLNEKKRLLTDAMHEFRELTTSIQTLLLLYAPHQFPALHRSLLAIEQMIKNANDFIEGVRIDSGILADKNMQYLAIWHLMRTKIFEEFHLGTAPLSEEDRQQLSEFSDSEKK